MVIISRYKQEADEYGNFTYMAKKRFHALFAKASWKS